MNSFDLGYGTNGFSNHRLHDAVRVIADLGYTAIGLTLDHHHLDPFAPGLARATDRLAALLSSLDLRCVVETGARYLLDPSRKHHPTLVSEQAGPRIDFLRRAVRIAQSLDASCVSFWSGVGEPGVPGPDNRRRMIRHLEPVLAEAGRRGVRLALEPEPGMVVQRLDEALELRRALGEPEPLGVTLDVGHCVAVEPADAAECVRRAGPLLFNVQLDDMLPGVHEHLEFGRGELDLAGTLAALDGIGYRGVAAVELPRHSHAAPLVAADAMAALRRARDGAPVPTARGAL
ncbi:sugar phosphate isomerase/epimerase family protein [Streptomyces sp. MN13]